MFVAWNQEGLKEKHVAVMHGILNTMAMKKFNTKNNDK